MNAKMYNLVMYNEIEIYRFIDALQCSSGKNISQVKYAYICHDKDAAKKEHWHLFLRFPEPVKSDRVENILTACNLSLSYLNYSKTDINFLAYLTHSTRECIGVKAPYDFVNIVSNMDDLKELWQKAVEKTNTLTRQEKAIQDFTNNIETLKDILNDNETIIDYSSLCIFLSDNGYYKELQFCINKCYAIKEMFKTTFKANSIRYSSGILKGQNRAKLADLQDEFDKANENRKKIEEIEEKVQELC